MTDYSTRYFATEGRDNMKECIHRALQWCAREGIRTAVMFTSTGDGAHYAATELLLQEPFSGLHLVAVTPPFGKPLLAKPGVVDSPVIRAGIHPALRDELAALGVPVIAGHLPFNRMYDGEKMSSEWSRVVAAFGILGGGFAFCIQAVLMACDAGEVEVGERVVAVGADTAVVVIASRSESFLSPTDGLLVEHIICRPERYTISKRNHQHVARVAPAMDVIQQAAVPRPRTTEPLALVAAKDVEADDKPRRKLRRRGVRKPVK